ncbi:MAG: hypothetical protein U5K28_11135 [Halobacteriales archaeon]|nr:hypothetical protein [Halobacteriales archaeon]
MNLSRFSSAVVAALVILSVAVGAVAAIETTSDGVPQESEVGTEVSATYTFTELYTNYESWTLNGQTNLTSVTWTVTKYNQAGNQIAQQSYDGSEFDAQIDIESGSAETNSVTVEVQGVTPEVETYQFEPAQTYTFAQFQLVRSGGTSQALSSTSVHHFTTESKEARAAIEAAQETIEETGAGSEAQATLENAIGAYNNEEFGSAVTFANNAQQQAQQDQSTENRNQLILYAVGGLVVVGLLVGGVLYWRSQQDSYDKLG